MCDFTNKMIALVDVLGPHSIIVVFNEPEHGLVVTKENGGCFKGREKFEKKSSKP